MNPFSARTPIRDPNYFFGRSAELHDLYTLLASLQNCSVVGPPRIGKSSFLYYLSNSSVYAPHLPESDNYIFALIDLQELTGLGIDDFFFTAVERLKRADGDRLDIDLDRDGTSSGFRRFLARASDAGLRLVLCCDTFEVLSQNPRFDADFFAFLRGLSSNYNLSLVTSSRDSLYDLCHRGNLQTSQFWNVFVERALNLMSEDEIHAMLVQPFAQAGMALVDDDIAFLIDLAGRHPLFVQIAAYQLYEQKRSGKAVDYDALRDLFLEEAQYHYAYAWNHLDHNERSVLSAVFQRDDSISDTGTLRRLKRAALIDDSQGAASIVSSGWHSFLQDELGDTVMGDTPTEVPGKLVQHQSLVDHVPARSATSPTEQTNIGRYEINAILGRGGMATVYRAHDPSFGRDVAIKLLPQEFLSDEVYRARFEREARVIGALEHPAILPVYDFGQTEEQLYLVMRLMLHGSLLDLLKQHRALSLEDCARIISRLASALDEAHAQGIVHRDLKPANVLFDQYGNAFLSDFGIAYLSKSNVALTGAEVIGTPAYMSPEQIQSDHDIDGRSDVYALGVMLFEMLTGTLPFDAESPARLLMMHISEPVPDIHRRQPGLPPEIEMICKRAMAKKPDARYTTAGQMAMDLTAVSRAHS